MFFIGGIMDGRKHFKTFRQVFTCPGCGQYAALEAFMTYTYLMFFFLPLFKWNKQYFVRSTCCGTVFQISSELGERIAHGEAVTLSKEDLRVYKTGRLTRCCTHCGYETEETGFSYCPHCGKPF